MKSFVWLRKVEQAISEEKSQGKAKMIQKAQNEDKKIENTQPLSKENSLTNRAIQEKRSGKPNFGVTSPLTHTESLNSSPIMLMPRRLQENQLIQISRESKHQMSIESAFQSLINPENSSQSPVYLINDSQEPKTSQDLELRASLSGAKAE